MFFLCDACEEALVSEKFNNKKVISTKTILITSNIKKSWKQSNFIDNWDKKILELNMCRKYECKHTYPEGMSWNRKRFLVR